MLSSKQRASLRAMAQHFEPIIHIGKDGILENLVKQADDALEARELIKCTVQQNSPLDAKTAMQELCAKTKAQPVSAIGRKFVIYRKTHDQKKLEQKKFIDINKL